MGMTKKGSHTSHNKMFENYYIENLLGVQSPVSLARGVGRKISIGGADSYSKKTTPLPTANTPPR